MGKVYQFFGGRCTTFAIAFTAAGIVLAFAGKLTPTYVALVGSIQALILGHSIKEDHFGVQNAPTANPNPKP